MISLSILAQRTSWVRSKSCRTSVERLASVAKEKLTRVSGKTRPSSEIARMHLCEEMRTLKAGRWDWGRGGVPFQADADNVRITSCSCSKWLPRVVKLIVKLEWLGNKLLHDGVSLTVSKADVIWPRASLVGCMCGGSGQA